MNTILPAYLLHIVQGQWSAVQALIFILNLLSDTTFFIEFGRRSQFRSKGKRLSES